MEIPEYIRLMIEKNPEAQIISDLKSKKILFANKQALELFIYDDLIGKLLYNLVPSNDIVDRHVTNDVQGFEEITVLDSRGHSIYVESNGFTIDKIYRISTFKDITKQKKQQKILGLQDTRISVLEMLNNFEHLDGQQLGIVSVIISGLYTNIAANNINLSTLPEQKEKVLEELKNAVTQIKNINNFKSFFKCLYSDDSEKSPTDVYLLMKNLSKAFELRFNNSKIDFRLFSEKDINLNISKSVLLQVSYGLIINSIDALEKSKNSNLRINLFLKEENNYLKIIFEDNAGGICINIVDKIFEPYFSTKNENIFSGLSLHYLKSLVEDKLSGKIFFENIHIDNKKGAQFTVEIPLNGIKSGT